MYALSKDWLWQNLVDPAFGEAAHGQLPVPQRPCWHFGRGHHPLCAKRRQQPGANALLFVSQSLKRGESSEMLKDAQGDVGHPSKT